MWAAMLACAAGCALRILTSTPPRRSHACGIQRHSVAGCCAEPPILAAKGANPHRRHLPSSPAGLTWLPVTVGASAAQFSKRAGPLAAAGSPRREQHNDAGIRDCWPTFLIDATCRVAESIGPSMRGAACTGDWYFPGTRGRSAQKCCDEGSTLPTLLRLEGEAIHVDGRARALPPRDAFSTESHGAVSRTDVESMLHAISAGTLDLAYKWASSRRDRRS